MRDREGMVIGHFWTENGVVKCSPELNYILSYEVREPGSGTLLSVNDGDKYLNVLPVMFNGYGYHADVVPDQNGSNAPA